jgi:type I restriction enzyme R subunit
VISDEAHRTQAGKLARNMRVALPHAAFIGFTGTPLFEHDQLTKRVLGDHVSQGPWDRVFPFSSSSDEHGLSVCSLHA